MKELKNTELKKRFDAFFDIKLPHIFRNGQYNNCPKSKICKKFFLKKCVKNAEDHNVGIFKIFSKNSYLHEIFRH